MRKFLIALIVVSLEILFPSRSLAQTEIVIDELRIMIWPEFDQPSVLVFYVGQALPQMDVAAELAFTLPEGASLNAAAYMDEQSGNLLLADTSQDGNLLSMTSPDGSFHIEFYDPALSFSEDQRTYNLSFTSSYAINRLFVEFQHPSGATNIVTTPANGSVSIDQVGLQATVVDAGALAAQTPLAISMSYTKDSSTLSSQVLNSGTGAIPEAAPVVRPTVSSPELPLEIIGGGIGIVLLAAAGIVLWRSGKFPVSATNRQKAKPQPRTRKADSRFCTQCGAAVDRDDHFCRNCGASLRST